MFFKKTKKLPELEKRLKDSSIKVETLEHRKSEILADILQAQDAGENVEKLQRDLALLKNQTELTHREIDLLKEDIILFHKEDMKKAQDGYQNRLKKLNDDRERLLDEAQNGFIRAVQIYHIFDESKPEGLDTFMFLPERKVVAQDLLDYHQEANDIRQLKMCITDPTTALHNLNRRISRSAGRTGVMIKLSKGRE